MGVDAAEVGLDEAVGDDGGVVGGHAVADEDGLDELFCGGGRDIVFWGGGFFHGESYLEGRIDVHNELIVEEVKSINIHG